VLGNIPLEGDRVMEGSVAPEAAVGDHLWVVGQLNPMEVSLAVETHQRDQAGVEQPEVTVWQFQCLSLGPGQNPDLLPRGDRMRVVGELVPQVVVSISGSDTTRTRWKRLPAALAC
jgi:hypothetical protein